MNCILCETLIIDQAECLNLMISFIHRGNTTLILEMLNKVQPAENIPTYRSLKGIAVRNFLLYNNIRLAWARSIEY